MNGSRVAVTLLVLAQAGFSAGAGEPPVPTVIGSPEIVFDWSSDRCATWDIPDTPARAWQGDDGMVRLVAGSEASRASVGPSLDRLTRDCAVLHRGAGSDDPGAYDDRAWLHATYRLDDGATVIGLAHVEFHGRLRRGPERDLIRLPVIWPGP